MGRHGDVLGRRDNAGATARKVEQRPQRAPGWLSRACSAFTQKMNAFVVKKVNVNSHIQRKLSGQLPFLG